MPKLIKDGEVSTDEWSIYVGDTIDTAAIPAGKWILPLALFLQLKESGNVESELERFGVSLASDDDLSTLNGAIDELPIIAIEFHAFADGRSFSQARILREHYDFTGEIRAIGAFIQDQMFYLSRCGVNSFVLDDDHDTDSALASLADFSESYQAACDEPQPLFRRRV